MERTVSEALTCEIGAKFFGGMKITVDVVDDATVDITSDPAQPILPLLMSTLTIVPAETPMEFVKNPIGTGPYMLAEWNAGQNIILTAREGLLGRCPGGDQGDLRVPQR